jgi:hypothetical protein
VIMKLTTWLETVTDGTLCGRLVTLQEGVDIMYNGAQARECIIPLLKGNVRMSGRL